MNDAGDVTYRVRTSVLSTENYGCILADLAHHLASMISQEGGYEHHLVLDEIMWTFLVLMAASSKQSIPTQPRILQ